MNGLLIVNNFLENKKSNDMNSLLTDSARKLGISLDVKKSGEIPHNLDYVKNIGFDFILFWDKDVFLAEMLEKCGYKVFNSSSAIFSCDNKAYTYLNLHSNGVRIPKTFVAPLTYEGVGYCRKEFADTAAGILGYPLVIKELYGSFGQQVYLVQNSEEMHDLIGKLGYKGFLMQEFMACSSGRDVRINVVGNRVVASMLRYNEKGDFRSNISNGGSMMKYDPSEEQKDMALKACRALGLDFAGVDVMFGQNGEPVICEVNSNPHFKSTLDCTGVDMSFEILKYIKEKMLNL